MSKRDKHAPAHERANVPFQSVDDVVAILRRIEQKMALPPV
jgi:hypothetical protein